MINKEPLNGAERRAVISLASLYSFRMLGLFMVLPILGLYAMELPGASPAMIGVALGAYGLTQASLQLPLGWLSDRIGRRPVVLAGLVMFVVGSLVAAYADHINGIILGRFLQGCGAIAAALTAWAADYTRDSQRTKTMAIIGASVGLSFVIALILGPVLAAMGGLAMVFLVTAGLGLAGLLLVAFVLPSTPEKVAAGPGQWEVSHIWDGGLPVLYCSIFLVHGLLMAVFLVLPGLLVETVGLAADRHWLLYLAAVLLSVVPAVFLMRQGRGKADPRVSLMVAIALFGSGLLLALNSRELPSVGLGMVMFFIGVNTLEATLPAMVSRLAPGKRRGTAMGIFSSAQFLGIFVGGSAGGIIMGFGGATAISVTALIVVLLWLVLVWTLRVEQANSAKSHE